MYFRIYKALNVLLWTIPFRKKSIEEMVVNTLFNTPFASMSVLLKDFILLDFDKHSSLFIKLLKSYML